VISITPNQILLLYSWFPLAAILAIVLLIARFYQRFSGERTYYLLYLIPLVFFGLGMVRYASLDRINGDTLADLMLGVAGVFLIGLSFWLYILMTNGRGKEE
jgi:hypothetical protein